MFNNIPKAIWYPTQVQCRPQLCCRISLMSCRDNDSIIVWLQQTTSVMCFCSQFLSLVLHPSQ